MRLASDGSEVNSKGLGVVAVSSLLARLSARLLPLLASLVLPVEFLGLAAFCGRVVRALAFLAVEDRPHHLFD
jgi:uncharacterized membrane protein YvlD (DUF360 family)